MATGIMCIIVDHILSIVVKRQKCSCLYGYDIWVNRNGLKCVKLCLSLDRTRRDEMEVKRAREKTTKKPSVRFHNEFYYSPTAQLSEILEHAYFYPVYSLHTIMSTRKSIDMIMPGYPL